MRTAALVLALLAVGCGSSPAPGPSPIPPPAPVFAGSVTDTVSGAPVVGFAASISAGRLLVSAPGYVPRETASSAATVDLIPEAGFDLGFYRQLARGALDGRTDALRVLATAPRIYLQTAGLSAANVAALEQAARAIVPALTGERFQVAAWETGAEARPEQAGWIVVELLTDEAATCGRALIGAAAGHVWLNLGRAQCNRPLQDTFSHELGHALGFWHVDNDAALMKNPRPVSHDGQPSALERHHAAIAYHRSAGNRDIDIDGIGIVSAARVIAD